MSTTLNQVDYSPHYGRYYFTPDGNKVLAQTYGKGQFTELDDLHMREKDAKRYAKSVSVKRLAPFFFIVLMANIIAAMTVGVEASVILMDLGMFFFISFFYYSRQHSKYIMAYTQSTKDINDIEESNGAVF